MVEIRKLRPLVKLEMPTKVPDWYRGNKNRNVQPRTAATHPPGTPLDTPCRLWQGSVDKGGYGRRNRPNPSGKGHKIVSMHRWVMEQDLCRKLTPDEVVMHLCDNPPCYRFDHLRLGTIQENNADRDAKGRTIQVAQHMHGETNGRARLTRKQVEQIKAAWRAGVKGATIARELNVHRSTIYRLVNGETWAADAAPEDIYTKIARKREEESERQRRVEGDDG